MEDIIMANPKVQAAIMFGRQRNQVGVLIEPAPQLSIDTSDSTTLAAFRDDIWTSVQIANQTSPAFSRIFKEMVLVTSLDKPLPRTPKGTIVRKAALELYKNDVEALYVKPHS